MIGSLVNNKLADMRKETVVSHCKVLILCMSLGSQKYEEMSITTEYIRADILK